VPFARVPIPPRRLLIASAYIPIAAPICRVLVSVWDSCEHTTALDGAGQELCLDYHTYLYYARVYSATNLPRTVVITPSYGFESGLWHIPVLLSFVEPAPEAFCETAARLGGAGLVDHHDFLLADRFGEALRGLVVTGEALVRFRDRAAGEQGLNLRRRAGVGEGFGQCADSENRCD
jgi:hypothetical protein